MNTCWLDQVLLSVLPRANSIASFGTFGDTMHFRVHEDTPSSRLVPNTDQLFFGFAV